MASKIENESLHRVQVLRELSDDALTLGIVNAVRMSIRQNAARIKAGAVESGDFSTRLNLDVLVEFSTSERRMMINANGQVRPPEFEPVKTGKKW